VTIVLPLLGLNVDLVVKRAVPLCLALGMLGLMVPTAIARTQVETDRAKAAKAEVENRVRLQAQARAKAAAQVRLHQQVMARLRMSTLAHANQLAAVKRAAEASAKASQAQKDLLDAARASHDKSQALAHYRRWAGNKQVWHRFQGEIPPEILRKDQKDRDLEKAKELAPDKGCATADAAGESRPANCEKQGS